MKHVAYISALVVVLLGSSFLLMERTTVSHNSSRKLFLIQEGNKWGYIDKTGKIVIPPRFYSATGFSEGLAAVRTEGLYGYIDSTGSYVIRAQYDYAEPFINGRAKVYIDEKPFLIDRSGKILFQHKFKSFGNFAESNYSAAETQEGKTCLIDITGKQLTGDDFCSIEAFHDGVAIAYKYTKELAWSATHEPALIDTTGKRIIDFDVFENISPFSEDLSIASYKRKNPRDPKERHVRVCIDTKGKVVYTIPRNEWSASYDDPGYHDGYMVVNVYKTNPDSLKFWSTDNSYPGVVDRKGELVFSNRAWKHISSFSANRAFAETGQRQWILIDRAGNRVGTTVYSDVRGARYAEEREPIFQNGKALVKVGNEGWRFIDTNGAVLAIQPQKRYYDQDIFRHNDLVLLGEYRLMYIWIPGDTALARKWYGRVDANTLEDDLISVTFPDKEYENFTWGYVTHEGVEVWRYKGEKSLAPLNIDYMNRGYFLASSPRDKEMDGIGGWGEYDNMYHGLWRLNTKYTKGKLQAIIDTTKPSVWWKSSTGYEVYLVNDSKRKCLFPAENSRINMVVQAQQKNGEWKDIEYLPHSWCGNSYHTLYLPANNYWTFTMPEYEGSMKTKLRVKVGYAESLHQESLQYIYSNEIDGSVNPAQFWRKREYFPQGIMDSYNE